MKKIILTIALFLGLGHLSFATIVITNGLTKKHDLAAGAQYEGVILLQNTGEQPEEFLCYLNDISTSCDGKVRYMDAGEMVRTLSPHLTTSVTQAVIAPGEEYQLLYKIDIPKELELKGTLWSLVMIEVMEPIAETVSENGFTVGSKIRYGVQVIANLGNESKPEIQFSNVSLSKNAEGVRVIQASIDNSGEFIALPLIEIKIYNTDGVEVKALQIPSKKVYPSNCQQFQLPLDNLESGNYKAVLFAEYNEHTLGLNIDLEI